MPPLTRRLAAGLLTAGVAVATLGSGPAAHASVLSAATPTLVRTVDAPWFTDPLSVAERRALVAVPAHPSRFDGQPPRSTRALHRTFAGDLAVPVPQVRGHQLVAGQAVVVNVPFGYPHAGTTAVLTRQLRWLKAATEGASELTCEGYVGYGRDLTTSDTPVSRQRAAALCLSLKAGRSGLSTTSVGYGDSRPVVVGGAYARRETVRPANRRVVVVVDRDTPPAAATVAPGAPDLVSVGFEDRAAVLRFSPPADSGTSPLSGFEVTVDGGASWYTFSMLGASGGLNQGTIGDLVNGTTYQVAVRASSDVGPGPASAVRSVVPGVLPGAVDLTSVDFGDAGAALTFEAPVALGTFEITGYEYSTDGGDTWDALPTSGTGPYTASLDLTNGTTYHVAVRAVSTAGNGTSSTVVDGTPAAPVVETPSAPSILPGYAHFDGSQAHMYWTAPASSAAITGYQGSADGGEWVDITSYPFPGGLYGWIPVTGQQQCGSLHSLQVRAVTADGFGTASEAVTLEQCLD